jgi:hypothetical protein
MTKKFEARVKEFCNLAEREESFADVATECALQPSNHRDLQAYATAYFQWLCGDNDFVVEPKSQHFEYLQAACFMAEDQMRRAAVEWVYREFGKDAAYRLESELEDDGQVQSLNKEHDERFENQFRSKHLKTDT